MENWSYLLDSLNNIPFYSSALNELGEKTFEVKALIVAKMFNITPVITTTQDQVNWDKFSTYMTFWARAQNLIASDNEEFYRTTNSLEVFNKVLKDQQLRGAKEESKFVLELAAITSKQVDKYAKGFSNNAENLKFTYDIKLLLKMR